MGGGGVSGAGCTAAGAGHGATHGFWQAQPARKIPIPTSNNERKIDFFVIINSFPQWVILRNKPLHLKTWLKKWLDRRVGSTSTATRKPACPNALCLKHQSFSLQLINNSYVPCQWNSQYSFFPNPILIPYSGKIPLVAQCREKSSEIEALPPQIDYIPGS